MVIIAFGITGDHMKLKILPAIAALATPGVRLVGVSRRDWQDADLRAYLSNTVPTISKELLERTTMVQGEAGDAAVWQRLRDIAGGEETLVILSISPTLYGGALAHLPALPNARIMLEKPFGLSGADAEALWQIALRGTREEDMFLVDHFLAKDWVRGLLALLAHGDPAAIEVRYLEEVGVEERGALYDRLGAMRDVVQNHLLQALAFLLAPGDRAGFLERLPAPARALRAQYRGYTDIEGVAKGSQTETYCRIEFLLYGVQVVLETGKRMPRTEKQVAATLQDGTKRIAAERKNAVPEYELLVRAALEGDRSYFVSMREVRAQWRFADAVIEQWKHSEPPTPYAPGSLPQFS